MATRNTGLEYILGGGAIAEFSQHSLPTKRDVLRLYYQFWKNNQSDSVKEKTVAMILKQFYESRNINTMSTFGIISKIKREINVLKKVLKFKTKQKTEANIRLETTFIENMDSLFDVTEISRQPVEQNCDSPMDVDGESEVEFFGMN